MAVRKSSDNSALTKSQFVTLLGTATKTVNYYTVPQDIIITSKPIGGGTNVEAEKQLLFYKGQLISDDDIALAFQAATVDSITPSTGLPAAGGTVVTIKGNHFGGATGVTFGGTAGTSFTLVDDATIKVTTPAKTAGTYDLVVQDDSGNTTVTNGVTFV